jgi:hypothetical protein
VASIVRDGVGQRHLAADFVRERQHRGDRWRGRQRVRRRSARPPIDTHRSPCPGERR